MSCVARSMISASSCAFLSNRIRKKPQRARGSSRIFFSSVNASFSSSEESDCDAEECAPEKEVFECILHVICRKCQLGVVGWRENKGGWNLPPRNRGWTGYVEKDTAGQTNLYSAEPAVYIAESAISSGTKGSSADGAENTLAIAGGLALISIAAASSVLVQVGTNQPQGQTAEYSGPPLSYYINKFKPVQIVEALVPPAPETSSTVEVSVSSEPSSISTIEASVPSVLQTSEVQEGSNTEVVPQVQVKMEQVQVQSATASNVLSNYLSYNS